VGGNIMLLEVVEEIREEVEALSDAILALGS
jgi:hypothetical protein